EQEIRHDQVNYVWKEATLKARLYNDHMKKSLKEWRDDQLRFIKENTILTPAETQYLLNEITKTREAVDAKNKSSKIFICSICNLEKYSNIYCEHYESPIPHCIVEWIEFGELTDIEFLAEGGFGKVHKAIWTHGKIIGWNETENTFVRDSKPRKVALKVFNGDGLPGNEFFQEAQWHQELTRKRNFRPCVVSILGFTRNQEGKYMIVLDYCEGGDLRNYLQKHYKEMSWKEKVKIAWDISLDIQGIVRYGSVHGDLHPGNILLLNESMINECAGCVPFNDRYGDPYLANDIICGLRPSIIPGTPKKYAELMRKCWAKDPHDRISAKDAVQILRVLLRDIIENNFIEKYSIEKYQSLNQPKLDFTVFRTSERLIISNLVNCWDESHSNSNKLILHSNIYESLN
ncbi:10246_t:CDS:2, partial [Dentiscutata heterogama]